MLICLRIIHTQLDRFAECIQRPRVQVGLLEPNSLAKRLFGALVVVRASQRPNQNERRADGFRKSVGSDTTSLPSNNVGQVSNLRAAFQAALLKLFQTRKLKHTLPRAPVAYALACAFGIIRKAALEAAPRFQIGKRQDVNP